MRIGFDAKKAVKNLTGIGNYSRRCVNAVVNHGDAGTEALLFTAEPGRAPALAQLAPSVRLVRPASWLGRGFLRELWRCWLVCRSIRRRQLDVYHGLSNELPFGIRRAGCASIVTIHDLIFLRLPETYGWQARQILRLKTRYACRVADRVVAISEATKRDLMAFYGVPEQNIELIYQSIHPVYSQPVPADALQQIRQKLQLPRQYVLCVGTIERRKNQLCLVRALAALDDAVHLVLVGRGTPYLAEVQAEAESLNVAHRLHVLQHVSAADLPAVYQLARVFCFMSVYEGFGLPVAEALASGVPVVAATGSCLEEAGGPASVYLAPDDHQGVARAVSRIVSDAAVAQSMAEKGRAYVRRFSDDVMARQLLQLYQNIAPHA